MRATLEKSNKKVKIGKFAIRITSYFLSKEKAGVRVEVRRFTKTHTVEIQLLIGDDKILLKRIYQTKVLKNPTKKQVDDIVEQLIDYAKQSKLVLLN